MSDYFETMRAYEEQLKREHEEQESKDSAVLDQVRAMVTPEVLEEIETFLKDTPSYAFQIVGTPGGDPQDDGYSLGDVFIDQSCGIAGDDFSGTVAMPLPDGRYFQFSFHC